jgi:hypothetical protein
MGFDCPLHNREFNAVEASRRYCCDEKKLSLKGELLPLEVWQESDGTGEAKTTATSQAETQQIE